MVRLPTFLVAALAVLALHSPVQAAEANLAVALQGADVSVADVAAARSLGVTRSKYSRNPIGVEGRCTALVERRRRP